MAKNDNPHALRFIASIEKKFEWAQNICEFLNDTYDDETIKAVRMDCACVKRIDQTLPKAWCYCTLGYTKKMFEYIFDAEVRVELLSSIKLGNENCRIRIQK